MKLKTVTDNFLDYFSVVFSKTMGQNALGVLYASLLGFGIMTNMASLNLSDQKPIVMHALAIFTILLKQALL